MQNTDTLKTQAINGALYETISRYGSGGAEFLKGLRGIDNETGKVFNRSLRDVSNYNVNDEFKNQNIKQQAGFSAEIAGVSKRNAEAVINGKTPTAMRSEDIAQYGKNHSVVDIVEMIDGNEITSQMKFVNNAEKMLDKIVAGKGKNDLSRYLQADKIEVPTEQTEQLKEYCRHKVKELNKQIIALESNGNDEKAAQLRANIDKYNQIEQKIADSGLTTEEAIRYRLNPEWETIKDIAGVSHRAGLEGAKFGMVVGGGISLISNTIAYISGDKDFSGALSDTAQDTLISAGVGYVTAFAGTAIKTGMQQATSVTFRNLSKTGLPAAIISTCIATGKSIRSYARGEIHEEELIQEMGLTVTNTLSSSAFTMLGQIAIPIPVLGGLIGGLIGYTLTNTFYQSFFSVLKEAKLSEQNLEYVKMKCAAAKLLAKDYETKINLIFESKLIQMDIQKENLLTLLNDENISADDFCSGMNQFAGFLGKTITINNMDELDKAMLSDDPIII